MREIKHHLIEPPPLDRLPPPSPSTSRHARPPQFRRVNPVPHHATLLLLLLLRFQGRDVGRRLRVLAPERGGCVVARRDEVGAAVGGEEGMREGEVAFADEEDAVGGGEGDVCGWGLGWRFRAFGGFAQGRWGRFGLCGWRSPWVWFMAGCFGLWPLRFAHCGGVKSGFEDLIEGRREMVERGSFQFRCYSSVLYSKTISILGAQKFLPPSTSLNHFLYIGLR